MKHLVALKLDAAVRRTPPRTLRKRLAPRILLLALVLVNLFAAVAPNNGLTAGPSVRGSGRDACGHAFTFRALGSPADVGGRMSWRMSFITGPATITGQVDCLSVVGRRAALSGVLNQPVPIENLTHFLIVVEDHAGNRHSRDESVAWVGTDPHDCAAELDGVLADKMKRITMGEIVV
jgi:hypothetical protein